MEKTDGAILIKHLRERGPNIKTDRVWRPDGALHARHSLPAVVFIDEF